jgi:multicomponent Na+:H+ antiporter subunit G
LIHTIINSLVIVLLSIGVLFFVGVSVGLLRMPDFYTRLHAASKGDTLSSVSLLAGCGLYLMHEPTLVNLIVVGKLGLAIVFLFIASPTAAHALVEAAYTSGLAPWTGGSNRDSDRAPRQGE